MPSKESKTEKKGPGFISKCVMLGILPGLYAIGLGVVVLNFSGVSFSKQLHWVESHTKPFLAKKETTAKTKQVSKKKAISTKKGSESNNVSETSAASNTNVQSSSTEGQAAAQASVNTSSAASSLANMDPESAAKLLSNMSEADALRNLRTMKADIQSAILAQMPADEAARLTVALETNDEPAATTNSSSQLYKHMKPDQIAAILKGISDKSEVLTQIKQMDPDTASKVLSQLDPKVAGWIVTQMN